MVETHNATVLFNEALKVLKNKEGRKHAILKAVERRIVTDSRHKAAAEEFSVTLRGKPKEYQTPVGVNLNSADYEFLVKRLDGEDNRSSAISFLRGRKALTPELSEFLEGEGRFGLAAAVELCLFGNTKRAEALRKLDIIFTKPLWNIEVVSLKRYFS